MCPDVLQYLTLLRRPHAAHPARLDGRRAALARPDPRRRAGRRCSTTCRTGALILGIGRGLGRVEFEGFGVNQEDSRAIFVESAQMILEGLERGVLRVRRQVREAGAPRAPPAAVQVVPRPHLRRRGVAGVVADHGAARHRHPDHPAEAVGGRRARAQRLPRVFREVNGIDAPPPIVGGWTFCDENRRRAEEHAPQVHRRVLADRSCGTTSSSATT